MTEAEQDKGLTELELRVLVESRKKSISEVAATLRISPAEVSRTLEQANRKISSDYVRSLEETVFLPRPKSFRLEKRIGEQQIGTMKVGSQIVEILSKGIYSAPWNSIKELISNSFDADAEKVEIQYLPEEHKLVVFDTGQGMDYADFDEHFTFIVRSLKRDKGLLSTMFKRPLIGKIGIGFIAVSELCDQVRVTSAKEGSDTYVEALIDFSKIRSDEAKRKEFYEISQFTLTNFKKEDLKQHYTRIELLNLKQPFIDILENKLPNDSRIFPIKPAAFEDVMKEISSKTISNVKTEMGPYWEFVINLALVIPVKYVDNGPIIQINSADIPEACRADYDKAVNIIKERKEALEKYNFKVIFNGLELKKPIPSLTKRI
ncbi:MAG: ATP-binding protein [Candidatus Bathyarchaeia archaeon]